MTIIILAFIFIVIFTIRYNVNKPVKKNRTFLIVKTYYGDIEFIEKE